MGDLAVSATTTQTAELPLTHDGTATLVPMEVTVRLDSAPATSGLNSSKQTSTSSTATHSAGEQNVDRTEKFDKGELPKKRRGPEFRCPYFAANPQTCQDAKCKSWHNPCIAAVTRHALRDSNKNYPTDRQSKEIKSLSHRRLSAEDRWKHYYEIHGGTDAHEQSQPYWPRSAKGDKRPLQTAQHALDAEFLPLARKSERATALRPSSASTLSSSSGHTHRDDRNTFGTFGPSERNSLDIQSSDSLSQALLELIARKNSRDNTIDKEIEERHATKIAALHSEIAREKLAEKSRNESEFVAGLKKIIMHSQSGNMPRPVPAGSHDTEFEQGQSEKM